MEQKENLLLVAMEECAELQQALSKAMRFGMEDHHPDFPNKTNEQEMLIEYYQLTAMIEELQRKNVVKRLTQQQIKKIQSEKIKKVYHYMKYSQEKGLVRKEAINE